jgi:hypothetical protein
MFQIETEQETEARKLAAGCYRELLKRLDLSQRIYKSCSEKKDTLPLSKRK